jgi:hypothetical protein
MGTRTEIGGKTESTNRNAAAGFESFLPNIMTTGAATNRNTQKFGAMKTAIVNAIHALHRFAKSLLGQYNWATGWASLKTPMDISKTTISSLIARITLGTYWRCRSAASIRQTT